MSAQPRLKRRNYGRGHGYTIDGQKVRGVTSILNALPKPALVNWAANVTAESAVDRWEELADLPPSKRLKELQDARWSTTKAAALRGTQIHDLGERLSHGQEVEVSDELRGPVEAYARFLDEWDVTVTATEAPCGSTTRAYAGTLDSIARIGRIGDESVMLDLKTGKGVYDDAALQLEAYARCDIWQPDGPESEQPMPEISALYIAHIMPDAVRLVPVIEDRDQLWRQFQYLQATAWWMDQVKEQPALGAALQLDDFEAVA
ncbi:hypothetical protein JL108_14345 [Aeromicrobium sp. YIM 150415]|uniref:hypothetical protein n=1 Tax=Aeromicrobium sp. YIM 150415 TaxID=2803912 RepID=UPI0019631D25|nr:hypothetical protein [Aeromicrobium sp. YIM 150415]MBM9464633.1 hypothetical protein [Aeromicrobium sp. YIM 150415]